MRCFFLKWCSPIGLLPLKNTEMMKKLSMKMILRNLKATLFLSEPLFEKETSTRKFKFKISNASVIAYYHTPSQLNVTGVKSFPELKLCKNIIETKLRITVIKTRIDCSFFCHKETRKNLFNIDLGKAYYSIRKSKVFFASFEPEIFAALVLKPYDKFYPTVLLFRTGSYTIIGGKSGSIIRKTEEEVLNIIKKFNKIAESEK